MESLRDTINYLYHHGDRGDLSPNQEDNVVSRDEFADLYQHPSVRTMVNGTNPLESYAAYNQLRQIHFGRIGGQSSEQENTNVKNDFFRGLLQRRLEVGSRRLERNLHRAPIATLRRYRADMISIIRQASTPLTMTDQILGETIGQLATDCQPTNVGEAIIMPICFQAALSVRLPTALMLAPIAAINDLLNGNFTRRPPPLRTGSIAPLMYRTFGSAANVHIARGGIYLSIGPSSYDAPSAGMRWTDFITILNREIESRNEAR